MAKLTPDYIEWVMSLNATQAQQEIQKLRKDNDELGKKTREVRRAMSELEAHGKKGSAEWRNLDKSLKEYNKEIALNKSKIEELTKRLKASDFFRDEGDGSATGVCPHCGKPVTVELK